MYCMAPLWLTAVPWSLAIPSLRTFRTNRTGHSSLATEYSPTSNAPTLQGTYPAAEEPQQCKEQRTLSAEAKSLECSS
ncbi:hypothetical protein FKP32DRAFT_1587188 [Trametes sanguinea]|nr:hypothetical protein FKP32DRAFT_1587188 [Trametes sanguinea]